MSGRRTSSIVEAHGIYLKYHRELADLEDEDGDGKVEDAQQSKDVGGGATHEEAARREPNDLFPMFHRVMKTGVIYATSRATSHGFNPAQSTEWANMGQGAPETGVIEGAPPRNMKLDIPYDELEYAPVTGSQPLCEKVAAYYNHLYRQGKKSQYTAENVCIVPGGRAGINRIMAVLGNTSIGYFVPDYTAYEQALGLYQRVSPSPFVHRDVNSALMTPEEFDFQCKGRGVGSFLLSNPANPTGQSIEGDDLAAYVKTARDQGTAVIMDEFYSHYYYDGDEAADPINGGADDDSNWPKTVSSAAYIDDVDKDPILIVNGLTKNWRCPGYRVCWIVCPKQIVGMLGSAGSYLDGGANAPLQTLALPMMDLDFIRRDIWALQRHFKKKRDFLLEELPKLGISVKWKPKATFYIWGDLSDLPSPLNDSLVFLEECVRHKVICVPGVFFDINPRGTRNVKRSTCLRNIRFSYGPPMENLTKGMKQIGEMIAWWKEHPEGADRYAAQEL